MKALNLGRSVQSGGWLLFAVAISLGVADGIYRVVSTTTLLDEKNARTHEGRNPSVGLKVFQGLSFRSSLKFL